ncbi:hypothetical protein CRENBAI_023975 [Crenichthys baileyi]|uniref:Uncharacterized protein n=1 Tax=Crenichthys baileyi TaxID=28760 RepID=A0AAV9S3Y8_9TELE
MHFLIAFQADSLYIFCLPHQACAKQANPPCLNLLEILLHLSPAAPASSTATCQPTLQLPQATPCSNLRDPSALCIMDTTPHSGSNKPLSLLDYLQGPDVFPAENILNYHTLSFSTSYSKKINIDHLLLWSKCHSLPPDATDPLSPNLQYLLSAFTLCK